MFYFFNSKLKLLRLLPWRSLLLLVVVLWLATQFQAPRAFPTGRALTIAEGNTVPEIAESLQAAQVIKSAPLFALTIKLRRAETELKAGDYIFEAPLALWSLSGRLINGVYSADPLKVTVPEGLNMREVARLLQSQLPRFDVEHFLRLAEASEGELMPDTYFFSPLTDANLAWKTMRDNFARQTAPLAAEIAASGRSWEEILVMSSLLEKEAYKYADKEIIAGILWKRLDDGMMLQVDAVFPYLIGKNTFDLTRNDLKIDSPYNTYKYTGLPPGPIANPGLDSIKAALHPVETPYWFYLSDHSGKMHYSRDYEEHKRYKQEYL